MFTLWCDQNNLELNIDSLQQKNPAISLLVNGLLNNLSLYVKKFASALASLTRVGGQMQVGKVIRIIRQPELKTGCFKAIVTQVRIVSDLLYKEQIRRSWTPARMD